MYPETSIPPPMNPNVSLWLLSSQGRAMVTTYMTGAEATTLMNALGYTRIVAITSETTVGTGNSADA